MSFMGKFFHSLDAKGRVIIPAKYREELGEGFVVTKGSGRYLDIYPACQWAILKEKIDAVSGSKGKELRRHFYSNAIDGEYDKQGRIIIPQDLREYACLDKEIVIAGVSKNCEIWNKASWDELYGNEREVNIEALIDDNDLDI